MFARVIRDPRRLQVAFVSGMLVLAATLGWLGWMLLEQDRELAVQRRQDQAEATADLVVAQLLLRLQTLHERFDAWTSGPRQLLPAGIAVVKFSNAHIQVNPEDGLAYWPGSPGDAAPDSRISTLVGRAAADVRAGRFASALSSYDALAAFGRAQVAGMPAVFAARVGRLWVFDVTGDTAAEASERRTLADDLSGGRWPVEYATYQYLANEAASAGRTASADDAARLARAEAAAWLRDRWRSAGRQMGDGRDAIETPAGPTFVLWRQFEDEVVGLVAGQTFVETEIEAGLRPLLDERGAKATLTPARALPRRANVAASDDDPDPPLRQVVRVAAETGLPWTVGVVLIDDDGAAARRRRVLVAGVGLLAAIVLGSGWAIGRALTRELATARLQSDFVSAVSHEFRTPLSTLYQLSEMLKQGRVASDAERDVYYGLLHAESDRLRRLVEGLLTFGRVESGRAEFQLAPLDLTQIVPMWVHDFASARPAPAHVFEVDEAGAVEACVEVDEEALRCALWNLLENAVKYSPAGGLVRVTVAAGPRRVTVAVRDEGVGIPRREQARIFDRFVRGEAARAHNIRGTGVGLALTRLIVRAHGGDVVVESEPGQGSTFTMTLPRVDSGASLMSGGRTTTGAER